MGETKFLFENSITKKGFYVSPSPNDELFAATSDTKVYILGSTNLQIYDTLELRHITSILWLDNSTAIMVSSDGTIYRYKHLVSLEKIGFWQTLHTYSMQYLTPPLRTFGNNCIIGAFGNKIELFNYLQSSSTLVFCGEHTEQIQITGVKDSYIHFLLTIQSRMPLRSKSYVCYGNPQAGFNKHLIPIRNNCSLCPPFIISDGSTVIVSEKPLLCKEKKHCIIYRFDVSGDILSCVKLPSSISGIGDIIATSQEYFAFEYGFEKKSIVIIRQSDYSVAGIIGHKDMAKHANTVMPSGICFLSEDRLVIGMWNNILLYRIVNS